MSANVVVIGLGSNLDSPVMHLRRALAEIKKISGVRVLEASSIFESEAQLPENAPTTWNKKFLNAALLIQVENRNPLQLLTALKRIEALMGRKSSETWAPRKIDLDILYWDNLNLNEPSLKIPHPQLCVRPFALLPLLQIFPEAVIEKPDWAHEWVVTKPFNTVKSKTYFWPQMIGIINLTEDSFSDGGQFLNEDKMYLQFQKLIANKVDILDLGAQSTRPQALEVDAATETKPLRVALKLLDSIRGRYEISIDSNKPEVIEACMENFDFSFINDVMGLRNEKMRNLALISKKKVFVMHSLSVPPKLDENISEQLSPIVALESWWAEKKNELFQLGLTHDQLIFDPGIGFGKTKQQNLFILKNLQLLHSIQEDILIGHSRKSYQTLFSARDAASRDLETALTTGGLNMAYTQYLRVHDVQTQTVALRWK